MYDWLLQSVELENLVARPSTQTSPFLHRLLSLGSGKKILKGLSYSNLTRNYVLRSG